MMIRKLARLHAGLFILLAGCGQIQLPSFSLPFGDPGVDSLSMFSGEITVVGPRGYCIDKKASDAELGFAALAPCETLNGIVNIPTLKSVITVQVDGPETAVVSDDAGALLETLQSEAGLALLGTSAVAGEASEDTVVVTFESVEPALKGISTLETRAFLDTKSHLTTISVRSLLAKPIPQDDLDAVLRSAINALRSANATNVSDS